MILILFIDCSLTMQGETLIVEQVRSIFQYLYYDFIKYYIIIINNFNYTDFN